MICISIGSNLGNRLTNLRDAVALIKTRYMPFAKESIVLETTAILPEGAPMAWNKPYLNMILMGESDLMPEDLLSGLKQIEVELGRPLQYERWAPRVIDLDILSWEGLTRQTPTLKLPHPELTQRPFLGHLIAMMDSLSEFAHSSTESCFSNTFVINPKLVGVVNITQDSFSDGGLYAAADKAIDRALTLARQGATIVELGAQSSCPTVQHALTSQEEYARLSPVLNGLYPSMKNGDISVSLDSYSAEVIRKALDDYPLAFVNDVKGGLDEKTLRAIAEHGCRFVAMHSLSIPPSLEQVMPLKQSVWEGLRQWAQKTLDTLQALGFTKEQLILDPGIGFGKTSYQNLEILRGIEMLKSLGCDVLIGYSRKLFMTAFTTEPAMDRDLETLAISALLADKVDYIRVHNVKAHQRFFVATASVTHHKDA